MNEPSVPGWNIDMPDWKKLWMDCIQAFARSLDWIGMIFIHLSTIPTLLAVNSGSLDKLPSIDIVLFIWAGLAVWFGRALLQADRVMVAGIGAGFIVQAVLLGLIVFK